MATKTKSLKMALALLMSASAGTLAIATPVSAQDQANFERYAASTYNYCDAKMIGAIFDRDPWGGKIIIGQKIANGIGSNIPLMLRESRTQGNKCGWQDLPHSYSDAEKLGRYWGTSTWEAKTKAAAYYTAGRPKVVAQALASASDDEQRQSAALSTFFNSGFTYCDAQMIGAYFTQDAYQGKLFIGSKIKAGLISNVPWYLDRAREGGAKCAWGEVSYNYDDAARLATLWGQNVGDTKTTIAQLVTAGRSDIVDAGLGR